MMSWNRVYQQLSSSAAIHASHQHGLATSMSSSSERGFIYLIHRLVYRYHRYLSGMLPYEPGRAHKITQHEQFSNDLHTFIVELQSRLFYYSTLTSFRDHYISFARLFCHHHSSNGSGSGILPSGSRRLWASCWCSPVQTAS